jgi:hypothetical protein
VIFPNIRHPPPPSSFLIPPTTTQSVQTEMARMKPVFRTSYFYGTRMVHRKSDAVPDLSTWQRRAVARLTVEILLKGYSGTFNNLTICWTGGFRFWELPGLFFHRRFQTHPSFYPIDTGDYFQGGKATRGSGTDHLHASTAEIRMRRDMPPLAIRLRDVVFNWT